MVNISIIIPVGPTSIWIKACLSALLYRLPPNAEVIIVADGAQAKRSLDIITDPKISVIELQEKCGPAAARNYGAKLAHGEFLVFIDSDVAVQPDTIEMMIKRLRSLSADGVYTSYAPQSSHANFCSRYKQLLNYYMHQRSKGRSSSFWGACSAIKKTAFEKLGGFDETFSRPSIEDIELGIRLWEEGYTIHLLPDLTVQHLKKWSLLELVKSDIFDRAVPWSKLIVKRKMIPNELNLQWRFRVSALLAILFVASLFIRELHLVAPVIIIFYYSLLNFDFYKVCYDFFGLSFSLKAYFLHFIYYLYSSCCFLFIAAYNLARNQIKKDRNNIACRLYSGK